LFIKHLLFTIFNMHTSALIVSFLTAATQVAAHGKIAVVTGDLGGNGTALGIKGAVVPGAGPNYETEVDSEFLATIPR
jgi:hypothetical protein